MSVINEMISYVMNYQRNNYSTKENRSVQIISGQAKLEGDLSIPLGTQGIVLFAHGSGSSRHSPRNKYVANVLQDAGIATLLLDLLTEEEEEVDIQTLHLRFDIDLLAKRLLGATDWLQDKSTTNDLRIGYFGASTGAAAALIAAAQRQQIVKAIVSRGGRPDLADYASLSKVKAPTLLIIGGNDKPVIEMNKEAFQRLSSIEGNDKKKVVIVPGATHLFEEPGKLEVVAELATRWFVKYLG